MRVTDKLKDTTRQMIGIIPSHHTRSITPDAATKFSRMTLSSSLSNKCYMKHQTRIIHTVEHAPSLKFDDIVELQPDNSTTNLHAHVFATNSYLLR